MDIRQYMHGLFDRGDDPYKLAGKRDDTMQLLLAVLGSQDAPQDWQNEPAPMPGPTQDEQDKMAWDEFGMANMGLDYDKVAQQAGGNVPGGNVSMMESTIKDQTPGASDAEFFKFVDDLKMKNQLDQMLDQRSRGYDPEAAKTVLTQAALREEQRKQDFVEQINERAQGGAEAGSGGRIDPVSAMALMNAGMRVPASAIDRSMTTMDYHSAVQKMRGQAINFLEKVNTTPGASIGEDTDSLYAYNRKIYEISMKYPDRPDLAYKEIMALDMGASKRGAKDKQGGWGEDESGERSFRVGS